MMIVLTWSTRMVIIASRIILDSVSPSGAVHSSDSSIYRLNSLNEEGLYDLDEDHERFEQNSKLIIKNNY